MFKKVISQQTALTTTQRHTEMYERIAYYLLLVFTFLFPMAITTAGTEIAFYTSAGILFLLFILRRMKIGFYSPLTFPLLLFGAWSMLGIFFALDKPYSLHDYLTHFLKYLLLYFMVINLVVSEKKLRHLAWTIVISAGLFCMGAVIYQYFILGISPEKRFGLDLIETPTNLIGVVTLFAMILSVRLFSDEKRRLHRVVLILMVMPMVFVTVFTQTRSNFVAMFLVVPILFYRNRKLLLILFALLLMVTFFSPVKNRLGKKGSIHHRISLFLLSQEIIKDHPITGIGFGIDSMANHQLIPADIYNQKVPAAYRLSDRYFQWPHNMFLSIAVRTGLVGMVLYALVLGVCFCILIQLIRCGHTSFIKQWSLCLLAAFSMFFVKGNLEPIFSTIPEIILFLILSLTALLWRMNQRGVDPDGLSEP